MEKDKLFVVRKYIYAKSVKEAIKKDKTKEVDDCWVDDDWKKENICSSVESMQFVTNGTDRTNKNNKNKNGR